MDGVDDLGPVDSLQVGARDAKVRVPELALDDGHRHPLARHLDRVCVPQLMRSEPPSHARLNGEAPQLAAGAGR